MKTLLYILPALAIALGAAAFAADEQTPGEIARSGQTTQWEIQGDARKLVAEIDATIDEYERNGLKGEELDNLKKLRQVLANMTDKDMEKIMALLQQASGAKDDPKAKLKALVDAYSAQKGVLTQLQQILNDYATEQDAASLAKQVSDLADRQAVNLQTGIETAQWALRGGTRDNNNAAAGDFSMQGQSSEQKAIADTLKQLQAKIAEMAANPNDQAVADRFKKGLEEIGVLNPILDSAGSLLDQKKLFDAVTNEKTARDGLRQLARTISPPRDPADALLAASEQLEKIISMQKEVMPPTDSAKLLPFEQWLTAQLQVKNSNVTQTAARLHQLNYSLAQLEQVSEYQSLYKEQQRLAKERLAGLEDQEGDITNQTDSLSQDIESIAKPASDLLRSAMAPMQTARGNLVDGDGINALQSEGEALAWLEKAKAYLDGQLAELTKADKADETADPAALQKQAQDLLAAQAALAKETAQPTTPDQAAALAKEQSALQQKTQELQQAAATSPAAQSLNAASQNMQQASTAMNTPGQNAQAQAQQQQAMQNLAAAGQQLAQQAAQAQQAEQQAAADQKELDALAKIIEDEQKLQLDTVQAAPKQAKQPALVTAMAPRQQGIKQDTDDFQKTLTSGTGADPQLIGSASNHMGDASGNLGKADATKAAPDEKKALDDLYAAQNALEAAMNAAENQAGQTQTPQQQAQADAQAAQAAAAIAQAQQQVAQAMNSMNQQTDAGQQAAANDLGQAAQTTGSAAAQDSALPGDAQQAMQTANQALTQAAGQAAAGQDAQAQASGQQAQAALAQAQAALAQAQAGLAANGQGQGQGQGQGAPGQGQGQGMGQGGQGQGQGTGTGGSGSGQGNTGITGPQTQGNGERTASKAQYMDLPPHDRATIQESQAEKYPQQYATKVEQYLQNLADGGDKQ